RGAGAADRPGRGAAAGAAPGGAGPLLRRRLLRALAEALPVVQPRPAREGHGQLAGRPDSRRRLPAGVPGDFRLPGRAAAALSRAAPEGAGRGFGGRKEEAWVRRLRTRHGTRPRYLPP